MKKPGLIVLLALVSAIPMAVWSIDLFSNVHADIKDLLPSDAESVTTLHELERRFGGFSQLAVVIESPDPSANRRLSDALVERLAHHPMIRSIKNKLGEERKFFSERKLLFVEPDDLEEILDRITTARAAANPLFVDMEDKEQPDFSDIEAKYRSKLALADRFPEDYFESADRQTLVVLIRKRGLAFDLQGNKQLVADVEAAIAVLRPVGVKVGLGGDVENIIEEQASLMEDLALASFAVGVLLALVVIIYYRRVRALYFIALPLSIGCAFTFGISHFVIGYLNPSSAFLGPIIPGNGMNFGLILLARYVEERRAGRTIEAAVRSAVACTARTTATIAAAASIAYGSLTLTDFLGFKHFGVIGAIGMICCWLATYAVMPPLIVWVERWRPLDPRGELRLFPPGAFARIPARWIAVAPRAIAVLGAAIGVVGFVLTAARLEDPLEKDFKKLRSTVTMEKGAGLYKAKVDAIFGLDQDPQVILAKRTEDVPEILAALQDKRELSGARALSSFVPAHQDEKMSLIAQIQKLSKDEGPPVEPFTEKDLPESIRAEFRELDGTEGRVVLAVPSLDLNPYDADDIRAIAGVLRSIRLSRGETVKSSGNFVVYADMIDAVAHDGPRATLYSFLGVLMLAAFAFRRPRHVAVVSSSLLLGVFVFGAVMWLFDLRINFLNFIALPITFGIGADYAFNMYGRYLFERRSAPPLLAAERTVISTGGAVALCSLTTVIGYASLLVARNGALVSFGALAITGELACSAAAILVLPAWLAVCSL